MKRGFFYAVLLLLITVSIAAGTLCVYTSPLDGFNVFALKQFAAAGAERAGDIPAKVAPGELWLRSFGR